MVGVKVIANDTEFQPELSAAGSRLAVVKFTMRGCGPCLRIAPAFNALSNKYPQATFLEVDVHQCQGTAATNNISATPTFLFFRNKVRIDQYQGADAVGLEEKIKQHLENDPGNSEDTDIPKGYMDLMPFINKAGCECLNESDEHGFDNCLRKDSTYLESDCDEQLLITVAFSQPVKLYSMKLQGPDNGQGPKYIKIFINLPRSMDFEEAERSEPTQALELMPEDIKEDGIIQLRYVKFQNVNSVTLFVQSNHGDEETTRITYFTFIGTPVQATNMNDFKRAPVLSGVKEGPGNPSAAPRADSEPAERHRERPRGSAWCPVDSPEPGAAVILSEKGSPKLTASSWRLHNWRVEGALVVGKKGESH